MIKMEGNMFLMNYASISGGAIYLEGIQNEELLIFNNTFLKNTAEYYGNDMATSPHRISVSIHKEGIIDDKDDGFSNDLIGFNDFNATSGFNLNLTDYDFILIDQFQQRISTPTLK